MADEKPKRRKVRGYREMVFGRILGDERRHQFDINAHDADLLFESLGTFADEYRKGDAPPEDVIGLEIDSEVLAHCHDLQRRIAALFAKGDE